MRFGISLLAIYLFFLVAVYAYRFDHSFSGFACGRYEQYSHCTTRCQTSCFSKNWLTRCQFLRRCRPGCVCQAGYVRKYLGGRGPCIPKYKCPKKKHCGKHQHWSKCKGHCQLTCRHPKSVKCPAICRPGCICNKGYVRKNDDGTGPCIKKKKCKKLKKKCRGKHQRWSRCKGHCQLTCKHPKLVKCPAICKAGCICKKGYVRTNDDGTGPCIKKKKCKKIEPKCLGKHQHFEACGSSCPPTCEFPKGKPVCTTECRIGCVCDRGYVRKNADGTGPCVKPSKCSKPIPPTSKPSCRGPHEHFESCGSSCPKTCKFPNGKRICTRDCKVGCVCDKGFVRQNPNGTGPCILPHECPKPIPPTAKPSCKGPHEHFVSCRGHCQSTCKHRNLDVVPCTRICKPGCVCDLGYVRANLNGTGPCIPTAKCSEPIPPTEKPSCKGPHEHFEPCGTSCPKTCEIPKGKRICTRDCRVGCFCDDGYVRQNANGTGLCILPSECPKPIPPTAKPSCKGPHEHFESCGSSCPKTCKSPNGKKICTLDCKVGCVCDPGFVRLNSDGTGPCILVGDCPAISPPTEKPSCKGEHEHYEKCTGHCQTTCKNPKLGLVPCTKICKSGCVCDMGYVRANLNGTGPCIPTAKCPKPIPPTEKPSCKGEHEHFDKCRGHCQTTCRHPNEDQVACTKVCRSGCICDRGFVRLHPDGTGPCILKGECPLSFPPTEKPSCKGKHEHFESCGSSCPKTCESPDGKKICTLECKVGCFCDLGFVRLNSDGSGPCIPKEKCSKPIPPTQKQYYQSSQ